MTLEALQFLASDAPSSLLPARNQMALSLGWHIILACFGVAFPSMIFVVHWRGVFRSDAVALELAKRWSKVGAVLFAIGAVSGTILSFELGLLWPGLMLSLCTLSINLLGDTARDMLDPRLKKRGE